MDREFSNKDSKSLVKQFQMARLDEWIGDLESANKLYDEIKKEAALQNKGLSYIMEPTVRERKKKVEDTIDGQRFVAKGIAFSVADSVMQESEPLLLYDPQKLAPKSSFKNLKLPSKINWKYTITLTARVDNDIRLEIRGYNPKNQFPKLKYTLNRPFSFWDATLEQEPREDSQPDLITFLGDSKFFNTPIFLSIDRWGLLTGTVITSEENIGDILVHIHVFLCELDNDLWS